MSANSRRLAVVRRLAFAIVVCSSFAAVSNGTAAISSTASGGNWSATATWNGGVVPTSSDDVIITDGSTVTIDTPAGAANSLTIGSGGSAAVLRYQPAFNRTLTVGGNVTIAANGTFQSAVSGSLTASSLVVGGDLINNGILDFSTNSDAAGAGITFTGAANNTFGGTGSVTDIRALTINKGTSSANVLELNPANFTVRGTTTDGTPMAFLTLTNGTLKISGNFSLTGRIFTSAAYSIAATAGFWLNNPNFTVAAQTGSATNNGLLRISQGTFNVGTALNNSMSLADGSTTIVEGGTINSASRFCILGETSTIDYTQTGGTITVNTVGSSATAVACFDLGSSLSSNINVSGGTIIVQLASTAASGPRDYFNRAGTGPSAVTGGTLQLGNAASGTAQTFVVSGVMPNLVLTNTSANHSATVSTTADFNYSNSALNMTINSGTAIDLGNDLFFFSGTTLTNNGTITHNGASSSFFFSSTTGPITYTGTGSVTVPMTALNFQTDPAVVTFDPASANIVTPAIRLFSGSVINANKITLGNGGTTSGTVQIGNGSAGPATASGTFDVPFTFNLGTGGEIVLYARSTTSKVTGPEINPTRTLERLVYDDNNGTHTLTISGGDMNLASTSTALTLVNGAVITGSNTIIVSSGTGAVNRTNGFVIGNLRKTFSGAASKTFEVGTDNVYSPAVININGGTFPAAITVKATASRQPNYPGALSALKRYWTITDPNGLTAGNPTTFSYSVADVVGSQAAYKLVRFDGATFTTPASSINIASHVATLTATNAIGGDWTLMEPDADFDGMTDSYENAHGLNANNAADALTDLDSDGQNNLAEYLAGTDPQDRGSIFKITSVTRSGSSFGINFNAVANKSYLVEFKTSLLDANWQGLQEVDPNVSGNVLVTDNSVVPSRFYRVRLLLP